MTLEANVTNRRAAAEEAVDAYNHILSTHSLFPPLPMPWQNVDLTLELNTAASTPAGLLGGSDVRKVIRPTLASIAESKRSERAHVESERIKVDDELDQLTLECENVDEEIRELEKKVVAINDQADDLRDVSRCRHRHCRPLLSWFAARSGPLWLIFSESQCSTAGR